MRHLYILYKNKSSLGETSPLPPPPPGGGGGGGGGYYARAVGGLLFGI